MKKIVVCVFMCVLIIMINYTVGICVLCEATGRKQKNNISVEKDSYN